MNSATIRHAVLRTLAAAAFLLAGLSAHAAAVVEMYKNPGCGCCGEWVKHMQQNGFKVKVHEVADPGVERRRAGLPDSLASCHTAFVGGYALEGHVPASDVKRMLAQKPKALGLAVPGMPAGSPGMAGPKKQPFDVLLVARGGSTFVYARH